MNKRKLLSTVMALAMGLSTLTYGALTPTQQADANDALNQVSKSYQGAPIDLGIANDERLIEMLKKEGKIAKDASPAEAEKELQSFLQKKAENAGKTKDNLPEAMEQGFKSKDKETNLGSLKNGKGNKLGQAKKGNWIA